MAEVRSPSAASAGGGTRRAPGIRRQRAAKTEAALKEAAKRVFARRGYLNTKITDITAEADRAAGSFYSHFASKEDLLEALLADLLAESDRMAGQPEHSADFTDPAAIRFHVAGVWRFLRDNRAVVVALHQASMVDDRFAGRLRELLAPDLRHLAEHLEYVRAAGFRLPGDPLVVASAITALVWQFANTWLLGGGAGIGRELSDDEAIDTLTAFIRHGIAGPA